MVFRRCILHKCMHSWTRLVFHPTAIETAPTFKRHSKLLACQIVAAAWWGPKPLSMEQHAARQTFCSPDCSLLMGVPDCFEPPAAHPQQGGNVEAGCHNVPDLQHGMRQSGFWVPPLLTAAVTAAAGHWKAATGWTKKAVQQSWITSKMG